MVQAQAPVGGAEVLGAIAPPGEQLLRIRDRRAHQVGEAQRGVQVGHGLHLDRGVADDPRHLAMAPDVELARGHVEVARDQDRVGRVARRHLAGQALEEVELVVELGIERPVGHVAAGRDVEVADLDPGDDPGDAAGVALAAGVERAGRLDRQARGDGHAVPALLAGDGQVRQAHVHEGLGREFGLPALGLLQADDVRSALGDEARHLLGAQPYRIDVPRRHPQPHTDPPSNIK